MTDTLPRRGVGTQKRRASPSSENLGGYFLVRKNLHLLHALHHVTQEVITHIFVVSLVIDVEQLKLVGYDAYADDNPCATTLLSRICNPTAVSIRTCSPTNRIANAYTRGGRIANPPERAFPRKSKGFPQKLSIVN